MKRKDKKAKRERPAAPVGITPWMLMVPEHLVTDAERITGTKAYTIVYGDAPAGFVSVLAEASDGQ